ncbi:MAG: glycoside hydrolase family 43 protein [Clostridia bacterium]|nr:glycoside hydrolase family 43 protein [Clostridia bacterium]
MRMKRIIAWLAMLMLCMTAFACAEEAVVPNSELPMPKFSKNVAVHDPSIIKADDGYYYIYGSHMAAARSADLIDWEYISKDATNAGCTLVENVQTQMKEALSYARTKTFWAPDVVQLENGTYVFYYCTCEGSNPLSMLGIAYADKPEGPYVNQGVILKSGYSGYNANHYPNVVDPCTFFDKEGRLWMVYGSYSGGIYILEMDTETGFPLEGQSPYGKKLLGGNHSRIEAPYILYSPETDYYYMFLSFGGLNANDGYNIRVCRSENPDGPYVDALGQDMIKCKGRNGSFFNDPDYEPYGVKLMGGYEFMPADGDKNRFTLAYRSPGHNSAYYDEETGRYFIVFHTRFANSGESFQVRVHQMYMNAEGWPVVSPLRYAGERPEKVDASLMPGAYKVLLHERDINKVEHESQVVTLNADGTITGAYTGAWACEDGVNVTMTMDGHTYTGVMHTALDSAQKTWVTCISALDENGAALWATRAYSNYKK